jgi:hypothetical protein
MVVTAPAPAKQWRSGVAVLWGVQNLEESYLVMCSEWRHSEGHPMHYL